MSDSEKVDSIWCEYKKSRIWKFLPAIGSFVVVGIWIVYNSILLNQEAIRLDSILPIIEAHRIDNILIGAIITAFLGILTYFALTFLTKIYFLSGTEDSELSNLLKRAKMKMGIDFNIHLRIHDEEGLNIVTERNALFSSIVMSRDAQTAILEQQDKGEVVLAGELSSLEGSRPLLAICGFAFIFGCAWMFLLAKTNTYDLVDMYGTTAVLTELVIPFILAFLGFHLVLFRSRPKYIRSEIKTITEYQISSTLARLIVFEKLVLSDEEIEKRMKLHRFYLNPDLDNSELVETFPVIFIVSMLIVHGILLHILGTGLVPNSLVVPLFVLSFIAAVLMSLLVTYKLNLIGGSKPSTHYELEQSSRDLE